MPHQLLLLKMSRLPRRDYNLTSLRGVYRFRYGERCRAAGNYAEQPVDLILLDINLPDENGLMLPAPCENAQRWGLFW